MRAIALLLIAVSARALAATPPPAKAAPAPAPSATASPATASPATASPGTTSPVTTAPPASAASAASPSTAAGAQDSSNAAPADAPMTGAKIIQVLDESVDWYRTLGLQQQAATEPSDLLFVYDNRQTANQVIALAFDIARANADLLKKQPVVSKDDAGAGDAAGSPRALAQLKSKLDDQGVTVQAELDATKRQLQTALKQKRPEIQAKLSELQGELDLLNTKKAILTSMSQFVPGGVDPGDSALKAQIDAMAVAIPSAAVNAGAASASSSGTGAVSAQPAASGQPAAPAQLAAPAARSAATSRFGLWDLAAEVLRFSEKIHTIDSIDRRTSALQSTLAQMRDPLLDRLKALSARGDALAAQADSADSQTLNRVHDQLDALAAEFKRVSASFLPLSKEILLLDQYRRSLANWHETVSSQSRAASETLGIRVGLLMLVLTLVFGAAELWRRAALKYVRDARRRYQVLLLRRIALWILVIIVIGIAFASELGSIITFAGLITAGIAVAMQSVLVSIVGYFFLIGKYGIRVGDRVQIGEVSGEVIDLGLVRMYLMELGGHGQQGPTGRVVAFANSVVFQTAGGLFKQISGVDFTWHDITVTLPANANYATVKQKLLAAVDHALTDYREEIVRQTREIQRTTESRSAADAQPQVQLHFSAAGVEAHIHYPVHLQHAAQIDERVSQEVFTLLAGLTADAPIAATAATAAPHAAATIRGTPIAATAAPLAVATNRAS